MKPIEIHIHPAKRRFGRRNQWRWEILAGNGEPIDPRDTLTNVGDIRSVMASLVGISGPRVELITHYRDGQVKREWLR